MQQIHKSGWNISMLIASNRGNFRKKATGRITLVCNDGFLDKQAIQNALASGEG
jgi:hypothetical protein